MDPLNDHGYYDLDGWYHVLTDAEHHEKLHQLLIAGIRDTEAKKRAAYEALPWWRRLLTRKPKQTLHGGYFAVFTDHVDQHRQLQR